MSGNNEWSVALKYEFCLGPTPTIHECIWRLQNEVNAISKSRIKYQTISGFNVDSKEINEIANAFKHGAPAEYQMLNDAIYCVPPTSFTKIKPLNQGILSPQKAKIAAFVTDRHEIILFLALKVTTIFNFHKALTLTPELEQDIKQELINIAVANNDLELKETLEKCHGFTTLYDNILYITKPLACHNFIATTERPVHIVLETFDLPAAQTAADNDEFYAPNLDDDDFLKAIESIMQPISDPYYPVYAHPSSSSAAAAATQKTKSVIFSKPESKKRIRTTPDQEELLSRLTFPTLEDELIFREPSPYGQSYTSSDSHRLAKRMKDCI